MSQESDFIRAQAVLHHAYLLGLQLMVSANQDNKIIEEWMFRLFRRQHELKFLSSFEKLGLAGQPHAVACAKYHVLSNSIGGVAVEYMYESDQKAWVRFRYPRWMYKGPTICGVPNEVCRGFLRGWYAQNGVSLKNSRLGFVCVSEDMTGEIGLCGYFQEYEHDLNENERLVFANDEIPPPYIQSEQPKPPSDQWNAERLEKANRNYAVEFIRNGLIELAAVIGIEEAKSLGARAARLIGLQYFQETRELVGADDSGLESGAEYLNRMFKGMGDESEIVVDGNDQEFRLVHSNLKILRGLDTTDQELILHCWQQLWAGSMASCRQLKKLACSVDVEDQYKIEWSITALDKR